MYITKNALRTKSNMGKQKSSLTKPLINSKNSKEISFKKSEFDNDSLELEYNSLQDKQDIEYNSLQDKQDIEYIFNRSQYNSALDSFN
jgi:hypothetical protein